MSDSKKYGCVHLVFKDNKFKSVLFHLENTEELPDNCVIRLDSIKVMSYEEFSKDRPEDAHEMK